MQGQGLSGQGLCARALYDYQAGKIPNMTVLKIRNKNVYRAFMGVSFQGRLKGEI